LTNSVGDPDLRSYAKTDANVPTPKIAPPVFLSVAPQVKTFCQNLKIRNIKKKNQFLGTSKFDEGIWESQKCSKQVNKNLIFT